MQALARLIPEMRFGQLIAAVGELCADLHGRGLWDASDEELLEAIWQFRRNFEAANVDSGKSVTQEITPPTVPTGLIAPNASAKPA